MPTADITTFVRFPDIKHAGIVANIPENDFLDAVTNLSCFLSDNSANSMMMNYNLNFAENRLYALDGHRLGWKNMESDTKIPEKNYFLLGSSAPLFKKILDKKSVHPLIFAMVDKHIQIVGKDFSYIQRKVNGTYFPLQQLLNTDHGQEIVIKTNELKEIIKYDCAVAKKTDRKPLAMMIDHDNMKIYFNNGRYELIDDLQLEKSDLREPFLIGFNPFFWNDIIGIISENIVQVRLKNPKAPAYVTSGKYGFVILPVNLEQHQALLGKLKNVA